MALVAVGKLQNLQERHFETARGPQVEHSAELHQEGEDRYTRVIVSYKLVDQVKELADGKTPLRLALFIRARKGGKDGAWHEVIVVGADKAA